MAAKKPRPGSVARGRFENAAEYTLVVNWCMHERVMTEDAALQRRDSDTCYGGFDVHDEERARILKRLLEHRIVESRGIGFSAPAATAEVLPAFEGRVAMGIGHLPAMRVAQIDETTAGFQCRGYGRHESRALLISAAPTVKDLHSCAWDVLGRAGVRRREHDARQPNGMPESNDTSHSPTPDGLHSTSLPCPIADADR